MMDSNNFSSEASMEPNARLKVLTQFGNSVDIDIRVPPRRYFRSGLEMVRMANSYFEEGSLENAFILYMKFIVLFIEKIRTHPEFASVSVTDRAVNSQRLREVLPRAEEIKAMLLSRFEHEYSQYLKLEQQRQKREIEERERKRREAEEAEKRKRSQQQTSIVVRPAQSTNEETDLEILMPPSTNDIEYPETDVATGDLNLSLGELDLSSSDDPQRVPDRNLKPSTLELPSVGSPSKPSVDRSTKPLSLLSPSVHSRLGLRRVIVPTRLMHKFMNLAQRNTEQNIETCGILAGRLNHDQLIISHLLVPKQHGTPDSCTTQSEEEIFDYQDQQDLITFGWIHTHPSQTAFLSSVDLHTHCSYQRMMPEAIAIVCAPRYKETGIYMLTPNHGLDFIANCRSTGFHPHPSEPPLFTEAKHSTLDDNASIEVVDLRR